MEGHQWKRVGDQEVVKMSIGWSSWATHLSEEYQQVEMKMQTPVLMQAKCSFSDWNLSFSLACLKAGDRLYGMRRRVTEIPGYFENEKVSIESWRRGRTGAASAELNIAGSYAPPKQAMRSPFAVVIIPDLPIERHVVLSQLYKPRKIVHTY